MPILIGLQTAHPDLMLVIPQPCTLCINIHSSWLICHSSKGQEVRFLVKSVAHHTSFPCRWGTIACVFIMSNHIWLHLGVYPLFSHFSTNAWLLLYAVPTLLAHTCHLDGPSAFIGMAFVPSDLPVIFL